MRALFIGPDEKAAVERIVAHATKPENYYRLGTSTWIPGDLPEYRIVLGGIMTVFTITVAGTETLRHMSFSLTDSPKMPNPAMVEEIAKMFGFTGTVYDWSPKQ